jgi:hypothetical protein
MKTLARKAPAPTLASLVLVFSMMLASLVSVRPAQAQTPQTGDESQYLNALQALELLKQGKVPDESPLQRWDIFRDVFSGFMQTEEYMALPQPISNC